MVVAVAVVVAAGLGQLGEVAECCGGGGGLGHRAVL